MIRRTLLLASAVLLLSVSGFTALRVGSDQRPGPPPDVVYAAFITSEIAREVRFDEPIRVEEGEVADARAVFFGRERAIVYSAGFLEEATAMAGTRWAAASIIAHEYGHHFFGHVERGMIGTPPRELRSRELEADYFSGYVLARLGASLEEAVAAQLAFFDEVSSPTHPRSEQRLRAIEAGWADGAERLPLDPRRGAYRSGSEKRTPNRTWAGGPTVSTGVRPIS